MSLASALTVRCPCESRPKSPAVFASPPLARRHPAQCVGLEVRVTQHFCGLRSDPGAPGTVGVLGQCYRRYCSELIKKNVHFSLKDQSLYFSAPGQWPVFFYMVSRGNRLLPLIVPPPRAWKGSEFPAEAETEKEAPPTPLPLAKMSHLMKPGCNEGWEV